MRVTHPFHPLFGQELGFVEQRDGWNGNRVYYRDADGYLTSLPACWTSLVVQDPFVVASAGRSRFRVADLLELAALVDGRKA